MAMTTPDPAEHDHISEELRHIDRLVSDEGGLIQNVQRLGDSGKSLTIYTATLGALERLHGNIRVAPGSDAGIELAGSGGGTNPRLARAIALIEAVERYSSCVPAANLEWATATELGSDAVDVWPMTLQQKGKLVSTLGMPRVPSTVGYGCEIIDGVRNCTAVLGFR